MYFQVDDMGETESAPNAGWDDENSGITQAHVVEVHYNSNRKWTRGEGESVHRTVAIDFEFVSFRECPPGP